uniref:pre-crRNA processing endonuclease n=1 Tax=Magnetococcus massalia (strain MO-1) TaxID=451514 RepID=A0A1S7LGP3_MAGMO|nr:CRISPR-associated protein, Csd5d family [Candidatus Magnetococcus massalia]
MIPTYEALKGICKSIYWKPTFIWVVDEVRVMKRIRTQTKGVKPLKFSGGNDLSIYTYLADVAYQVRAHFEWNEHRPELSQDRIEGKHFSIARRMVERGGRQDIFLGTRECQGYVEPCRFGEGDSELDGAGELAFGSMFHGFDYPDESGRNALERRLWNPLMRDGVITFPRAEDCPVTEFIREMQPKQFDQSNILDVQQESALLEAQL